MSPPASPSPSPSPSPETARVLFVRNPRAKRYILRVGPDRQVRVTIPRAGSEAFARRFLDQKRSWVQSQLTRLSQAPLSTGPIPWRPGTLVWYRGQQLPLAQDPHGIRLGDLLIPAHPVTPDASDWRPMVEAHLRELAEREFPPLVLAAASRWNLSIQRVSVRNQRTRWGSCSRRGTISLNWHLIQTPILVRDYLIAHELAHVREMNHSRRYWKLVAQLFPEWRQAEAWLKQHGRQVLHPRPDTAG